MHTDKVRNRASPASKSLSVWRVRDFVRKYVVWLSQGGSGGFTGIFRDVEICPGFPPPQAALVTVAPRERGFG